MSDSKELQTNQINLDNLPDIDTDMSKVAPEWFKGLNDVEAMIRGFSQYLDVNKRTKSKNTKTSYISSVRQFLVWCNRINFAVRNVTSNRVLTNVVISYDKALCNLKLAQNSVAIKQSGVKKFFEYFDFMQPDYNLDLRKCFKSDWVTTTDSNAFKKQTRINDAVFEAIKEVVDAGDINDKWIFFFFAFGCRRSEIATIKTSDLDFLNKEINIYQHKQGTNKRIPMPDWCSEGIINKQDNYLIHNKSKKCAKTKGVKPVSTQYIYSKLLSWRDQTKFKGVNLTPHSMRRYFVSSLLKQGASDSNIAKLGGWHGTSMIFRYGFDVSLDGNPIVKNNQVKY